MATASYTTSRDTIAELGDVVEARAPYGDPSRWNGTVASLAHVHFHTVKRPGFSGGSDL